MFFPRLRRQAKWVFLFLALAFGIGFVGFGVGAGGVGVGDVFRGVGVDSGVPSVSEAERRVSENPSDPQAFRDLANAHQAVGDTAGAVEALERVIELRPRNVDAHRELAALYLALASEAQRRGQVAEARAAFLAPGSNVSGTVQLGGRPLDVDPISSAVSGMLSEDISRAYGEAQQAASNAVETYRSIATLEPDDPNVRLELAQAAQSAGDIATAIEAYEAFVRLAPDDPTTVEVRRILRQLRSAPLGTG